MSDHKPGPLTINDMADMAYETATNNGFHDDDAEIITCEHPQAKIAALAPIALKLAAVIEAVRKPQEHDVEDALFELADTTVKLQEHGLDVEAYQENPDSPDGYTGAPVPLGGSKTQIISQLILIISEAAEAIEAVLNDDWQEFGVECADKAIRIGDMIGHYNRSAERLGRPLIDLEATILAKNERNKARGYRHGGKRA